MSARRVAFFDVDETILQTKTMIAFWQYWQIHRPDRGPRDSRDPGLADLLTLPREEANRGYYRLYGGVPSAELAEAGRRWYEEYRRGESVVVIAALNALRRHQRCGDTVVLVSGSMRACLEPVAEELGVDLLLCTEQERTAAGVFTGELLRPMIGPAKAAAVTAAMHALRVDPRDCFAYGDHASDLGMLEAVGHPVVVGGDSVLLAAARAGRVGHWRVLPSTGGPLEACREEIAA
ncbi:HAD family phosphatase [Streptomyces sp. 2132.2]|uniref:HAD family hydrolase n=1 Tax=Streptomyces sp. 2132.2 TaxID=2485161 RepID=UPI0021A37ECC|nr:HAD-IB family hydrolase [Streptomyces sp. 2132.2]